ncbi:MAG: magnesium transporter [Chloroflexota bacterium]|jgi:magnesium transporter|nr:magnesium transporter [Chloroflexota bacterium]
MAWSEADGLKTLIGLDAVKKAYADKGAQLWIDLISPDAALLAALTKLLGLHPLVTEDILERNQRAKIETTGDALHLVMFALDYSGEVVPHELDIVLGPRYLLTAHDDGIDLRGATFMRREAGIHLADGADYMLWSVTDWLVDQYFPVFDKLGDEIDELEVEVVRKPGTWVVERLFTLRRDLLEIRHAVNPQREIFNQLTNRDLPQIKPERIVYFRDVYDHLIRLTDELDSYRELVSTTLDIYLSQINNNLSEIMKRLTGVTVILATIGAVAGVFGMSEAGLAFQFKEAAGFWLVTGLTVVAALLVYYVFHRRGWI